MRRDTPFLIPALIAAPLVALLGWAWLQRLSFPFDLEWMEGGTLVHALRLQRGLPLFVAPGPGFIPFIYPPGYAALVALLGWVIGLDYPAARLLSLTGVIAAAGALAAGVRRHAGSLPVGLLGGATFLGTYAASGTFFDLARGDGVLMGLLAWSWVMAADRRRGAAVAAGLLLAAAFSVKQSVAIFGFPIALALWMRGGWREAARFVAAAALPALGLTLALEWASGGRFLSYTLGVPASHPMNGWRVMPGTPWELGAALPVALLSGGGWVAWRSARGTALAAIGAVSALSAVGALFLPAVRGIGPDAPWQVAVGLGGLVLAASASLWAAPGRLRSRSWRWTLAVGLGGTVLFYAAMMRGHHGGFVNVLMPLHWAVVAASSLAVARLAERGPRWALAGALALAAQLALQLTTLDLPRWIPSLEDVASGEALVAEVAAVEGQVWAPYHAWIPVQAGKNPDGPHLIALWDIDHPRSPMRTGVASVEAAAAEHRWGAVLRTRKELGFGVEGAYRTRRPLSDAARALHPRTGWPVRPDALWLLPWDPGDGPTAPPQVSAAAPLDRGRYHLTKDWAVLDLGPALRWAGEELPAEALRVRAKGQPRVWVRAEANAPAALLREAQPPLTRAGVSWLDLEVRSSDGAEGVLSLSAGQRPSQGEVDMGLLRVVAWGDRFVLSPMGAPHQTDITVDAAGLARLWELLGGLPPLIPLAAVPGDATVQQAVDALIAARQLHGLESATLSIDAPWEPD
ncbi:MAG: DUF2029 domain-containing protein, partial [Deltaproteobacteria bacterium]|nr:DUF2029 domain-containing protein [Deltaproteobacteria bacterium]